jgi:hypothetical protein
MANNQQGKRSQNDPNAPQNQGKQSIQSSDQAQHLGSTDESRSVQSGVSGIPSQMHVGADRAKSFENRIERELNTEHDGEGKNRSQPGNYGTAPVNKGSESRDNSPAND